MLTHLTEIVTNVGTQHYGPVAFLQKINEIMALKYKKYK